MADDITPAKPPLQFYDINPMASTQIPAPGSSEGEPSPSAVGTNLVKPTIDAWEGLKEDFSKAFTLPASNLSTWDAVKASWSSTVASGKTALDVLNLATSPVSGIFNAAVATPLGYGLSHLNNALIGGPAPGHTQAGDTAEAVAAVNASLVGLGPEVGKGAGDLAAFRQGVMAPAAANPELLAAKGSPLETVRPEAEQALGLNKEQMDLLAVNSSSPGMPVLHAAKDLGVFGPETILPPDATVQQMGDAAVHAPLVEPLEPPVGPTRAATEGVPVSTTSEPVEPPHITEADGAVAPSDNPGNLRELDILGLKPEDQEAITASVGRGGGFMPARGGLISQSGMEALSDALGVDVNTMDRAGFSRILNNDSKVKYLYEGMIQASKNVAESLSKVNDNPLDDGAAIDAQEQIMRHQMALDGFAEHVSGLKAEWARTGHVLNSFLEQAKDAEGFNNFMKEQGKPTTLADVRRIAGASKELDPARELPRFLKHARAPDFQDKFWEYYRNSLLSGPPTHLAYALNTVPWALMDVGSTAVGSVFGAARKLTGKGGPVQVLAGEAGARLYGFLNGFVPALRMGVDIVRTGQRIVLPGGKPNLVNPFTNAKEGAIGGVAGTIINTPTRVATAIHGAQSWLGYSMDIHASAYRQAMAEGMSPFDPALSDAVKRGVANPTPEAMAAARENADRLSMTGHLGPKAQKMQSAIQQYPLGKLIFPFMHMQLTILKAANSLTPMAFLDEATRADLLMKNGGAAFDKAWGRIGVGSAAMGYVMWQTDAGNMTGGGPPDPRDYAIWAETHKPYSIKIQGQWVDYTRLGPIGAIIGLGANLHDTAAQFTKGNYEQAATLLANTAGHYLQDGLGLSQLKDLFEAATDVPHKAAAFLGRTAGSFVFPSTFMSQAAGATDPYLRQVKTFMDGLKHGIPGLRETLLPIRDAIGRPVADDKEGFSAVYASRLQTPDPITAEFSRLNFAPAPMDLTIGGIPLTRAQGDQYQTLAGMNTAHWLNGPAGADPQAPSKPLFQDPAYTSLYGNPNEQAEMLRGYIRGAQKEAQGTMQMLHPELISAAIQSRTSGMKQRVPFGGRQ